MCGNDLGMVFSPGGARESKNNKTNHRVHQACQVRNSGFFDRTHFLRNWMLSHKRIIWVVWMGRERRWLVIAEKRDKRGTEAGVSKWLLFRCCRAMTKKARLYGSRSPTNCYSSLRDFQCCPFASHNRLPSFTLLCESSRALIGALRFSPGEWQQCLDRVGNRRMIMMERARRKRRKQKVGPPNEEFKDVFSWASLLAYSRALWHGVYLDSGSIFLC